MNSMILIIGGLLLGLGLLYYGATWLVMGGSAIAIRACVSPLVVGLTLVAFGTSAPELFVSTGAAMSGLGDVCVGNVVGSNICNIALILGLAACIAPLKVNPVLLKRDIPIMTFAVIILFALCCCGGGLGRIVGALFLVVIVAYAILGIKSSGEACSVAGDNVPTKGIAWALVIGGLLALIGGAKLILDCAVDIEHVMGVPDEIIALTVVAVGTSLPELATSVIAARRGEADIAIGNVVGSNIFNVFGILGTSALLRPVRIEGMDCVDFGMAIAVSLLLWLMVRRRGELGRREGIVFLIVYAIYLVWLMV